jgi:serralysin
MANEKKWCYAWFAGKPKGAGTTKAALQKDSKWKSGDTISIAFLEGDDKLKKRVREVAERWVAPGLANLTLAFNDRPDADIRIAFKQGDGSWSTVGTTCRRVPKDRPTMNYGWIDADSPEEELRSVVLHEFGHALGLIHEHQNPEGGIKWNREAVLRELSGPPNNWSPEEIAFNVLDKADPADISATAMDPKSIMMYPIPAAWTTDGFSAGINTELSEPDKKFIHKEYT